MFRKIGALIILFSAISHSAYAQTQGVVDKKFLILNGLSVSSSIYDLETTYYALDRCKTCYEGNIVARPFIEAGKPYGFTFMAATDAAEIYASYWLKKRNNKVWFIIPVVSAAAHIIAGIHNINIAKTADGGRSYMSLVFTF